MNVLLTLIIIILVSYVFYEFSRIIKVPSVVGLIVAGIILGYQPISSILIAPNTKIVEIIGDVALICLMLFAGFESSWSRIYKERNDSIKIALFGATVPFLMGFTVFNFFGYSILVSSIIGISMSITAEATKARVLLELKKLRTTVGSAMLGAGIIDDAMALVLFVGITHLLGVINFSEDIIVTSALIAFFAGVAVQKRFSRKNKTLRVFEKIVMLTIIPFFFISMGLRFEIQSLVINPTILLIIMLIAISGKLLGAFMAKPFTNFTWKQVHLIGWGMNSRGAMELAIVLTAFKASLIPVEIYSSLVVMALLTTLIFPFIITRMIKKYPKLMD